MASNITATTIDADYPIAGQDNDSQGFRDNFSLIKNSLLSAKSEIEDLQNNTIKSNQSNNYSNLTQTNLQLDTWTETIIDKGTVGVDTTINWDDAPYQIITLTDSITITLSRWPASPQLGKLRLQILSNSGGPYTINFVAGNGGVLKTNSSWPDPFTINSTTDPIIVDFWTKDNGVLVFGDYHGTYD